MRGAFIGSSPFAWRRASWLGCSGGAEYGLQVVSPASWRPEITRRFLSVEAPSLCLAFARPGVSHEVGHEHALQFSVLHGNVNKCFMRSIACVIFCTEYHTSLCAVAVQNHRGIMGECACISPYFWRMPMRRKSLTSLHKTPFKVQVNP